MSSHQKQSTEERSTKLTQDSCNDNKEERNNKLVVHICSICILFGGCSSLYSRGVDFMRVFGIVKCFDWDHVTSEFFLYTHYCTSPASDTNGIREVGVIIPR